MSERSGASRNTVADDYGESRKQQIAGGQRLKMLRTRAGIPTATAAARIIGVPRGSYLQHENGLRPLSIRSAQQYAAFFKVPVSVMLEDEEAEGASRVVVVGIVTTGGTVNPVPASSSLPQTVVSPDTGISALWALFVHGDVLGPRYRDGDVIFYEPFTDAPLNAERINNRECVIELDDGARLIRHIILQADGNWTLISGVGPVEIGRKIIHAGLIVYIKPNGIDGAA